MCTNIHNIIIEWTQRKFKIHNSRLLLNRSPMQTAICDAVQILCSTLPFIEPEFCVFKCSSAIFGALES